MIRTKRVYEKPTNSDGLRVLVDRVWPRGLSKEKVSADRWMKDLAPSDALRRWFGHKPERWARFREEYHRELEAANRQEAIEAVRSHARENIVTLLFAAKDVKHNNAVALREFLER